MRRWIFTAVLLCGAMVGLTGLACAEPINGTITAIDAGKKTLDISKDGQVQAISVKEFFKKAGPKDLNSLNVGQNLDAEVRKNKDGALELVAIKWAAETQAAEAVATPEGQWLKSTGEIPNQKTGGREAPHREYYKDLVG